VLDRTTTCICVANADGTDVRPVIQSQTLALKWFDWVVPDATKVPKTAVTGNAIGSKQVSSKLLLSSTDFRDDQSVHVWEEPVDMMRVDSATAIRQDDFGLSVETAGELHPTQATWSNDRSSVAFVGTVPYDLDDAAPGPAPPAGQTRREHATLADVDPAHNPRTVVPDKGSLQQIFLRRSDGLPVQITTPWTEDWRDGVVTGDARSNTDPVLSPDGNSLVFSSHSTLTNESFLVRMDLLTGEVLNLTNGTAGAARVDDSSPKWSPDSSLIAFTWTEGAATDVFVMRASDGLEVTHVTDDLATNLTPSWSPDGTSIVYSHHDGEIFVSPNQLVSLTGLVDVHDTGWSLVKVDVATGQRTVLTRPGDPAGWKPVWAPEGDRIYFIGEGPDTLDVFTVSPSGGDVRPLLITPFINETSIDWR
jgi:dipeptidyl aminopeptidase/acylaminoacyl peptidase